jgi:hypothetical protein
VVTVLAVEAKPDEVVLFDASSCYLLRRAQWE